MSTPCPAFVIHIAVQTPLHSQVGGLLSYTHGQALEPGTLVRVPLGQRELLGVVWQAQEVGSTAQMTLSEGMVLRPVAQVLDALSPLAAPWRRLVAFTARYYQRSLGEIAAAALPPALRKLSSEQLVRRLQAKKKAALAVPEEEEFVALTAEQESVFAQIKKNPGPFLLYGSTGSGKTEVYLHTVAAALAADPQAQALVLVPEINLTPQLLARFERRFAPQLGPQAVVSLHSGLTEAQRLKNWLAAHQGQARIVLGTRMAVLASLPQLKIIVVDEEHDPSFKQEEGARYSARDLALWRGRDAEATVILGSATPSLESWHACQQGRYQRLDMPSRVAAAPLPAVQLVNMRQQPKSTVFAPALLQAITERIQRGEQSLVLLNRRGFAPVLWCGDCGWKSYCPHCSAHQVFHKGERRLRCHHCSASQAVPRHCPQCGNPDILPLGHGTEQLQEALEQALRNVQRPDGQPARIGRMDADTTQGAGQLQAQLAQVHDGHVDVLVGTQMIAKGHDFRRMTLVAAVAPDAALMSSGFRAPERLFALLMQAAGRAGRDGAFLRQQGSQAQMWIQTQQPEHPLYQALQQHDYPGFAQQQLHERQQAGMPPFVFQALVRADAKTQDEAQKFLHVAAQQAQTLPELAGVYLYPPIPMALQRVANVERAQMLIEAASRSALQKFLHAWQPLLHPIKKQHKAVVRWLIDVDAQNL